MASTLLLCILAFFLPPLAVYLHENACNNTTIINLILTILFWLPGTYLHNIYLCQYSYIFIIILGFIHALFVILF